MKYTLNFLEEIILYFLCFFPFIRLPGVAINTDVQPYALIFSICMLGIYFIRKGAIKIQKKEFPILFLLFFSTVILFLSLSLYIGIFYIARSYLSYISIGIIPMYVYRVLKERHGIREQWIKNIINLWLIIGILQKYVWSSFGHTFVSNVRTTANRGVISLASEPSFYGYMCFFMLLFAIKFETKKLFYILNLLFQIICLAQSSVTMVYLIVFLLTSCMHSFVKGNVKRNLLFLISGISGLGILYWYVQNNHNTRAAYLLYSIFHFEKVTDLLNLIERDESIQIRLNQIIFCVHEFLCNWGIPHCFSLRYRLESGYGALLYELGWVGLLIIIALWRIVYKGYQKKWAFIIATTLTIVLFSAIQMSLPTLGFFIGYMLYESDKRGGINVIKQMGISVK